MESSKKTTEKKPSHAEDLSQEISLNKAISTLKKHTESYQSAGFTHISSLLV